MIAHHFLDKFHLLIETLLKIFFISIVALVFVAALSRWFGYPIASSIDIAQILFAWTTFLGADVTLRKNGHIGIDILVQKLSPKMQKRILLFNYTLMSAFLGTMIFYGIYLCYINYERLFNVIQISYTYATASVPVGCTLMLITLICKILDLRETN